jgi:glycosyltransferase involved in cell wall biosynthesis
MSKVQVLIATMHQNDHSLLEKMNIQTEAVVGNQCDRNEVEHFEHNGRAIDWFSFAERGVGLNRNNALMRAKADYCLFADDDMVFRDGYEQTVIKAFEENPKADVLIFNLEEEGDTDRRANTKARKIGLLNYMNYGAARFVIRRSAVSYHGISFNQNFGGGTPHNCGEDTLFLRDCLKEGLRMYAVPYTVAKLTESRESSWFKGYTEKYFFDKGVVFGIAHPVLGKLFSIYIAMRHGEYVAQSEFSRKQILKFMFNGIKYAKGAI